MHGSRVDAFRHRADVILVDRRAGGERLQTLTRLANRTLVLSIARTARHPEKAAANQPCLAVLDMKT
jgi:hypothetical protein